jgi:hypothetical protein
MSLLPLSDRALGEAVFAGSLLLALAGCATWHAPAEVSDAALRARAVTANDREVHVTAAVLTAEDGRRMFGADVDQTGVQSVWIEVQNRTSQPLWLLRSGTDPDYFSPLEVAWSMHAPFARGTNSSINDHFDRFGFKNPIPPGATRTGILFTNPQRSTKLLNIDLLGNKTLFPFSLFMPVPDDSADERLPQLSIRYPDGQVTDFEDLAALRAALERSPCCATDADGSVQGDPLNAVFIGTIADIGAAGVRRGYRRDSNESDTVQRVFGRKPEFVARKQAQAGAPATWIRLWVTPMRFDGKPVFVAQVGRPVGGRFGPRAAANILLHEDVDEARNLLIQDMMYSGGLEKLGFVTGVGAVSESLSRTTLDGARYHTDGLRAVLFFATRPLSLSDVEFLEWVPYLERREAAAGEQTDDARK